MNVDDLTMSAYKESMPDTHDLTVPQWLLWYRLRDVYRDFLSGKTNMEKAEAEKKQMLRQYDQDCNDWMNAKEVWNHMAQFWKQLEPSGQAYAKNPTVTNADRFFEAVYKVPRKTQAEQWQNEQKEE